MYKEYDDPLKELNDIDNEPKNEIIIEEILF